MIEKIKEWWNERILLCLVKRHGEKITISQDSLQNKSKGYDPDEVAEEFVKLFHMDGKEIEKLKIILLMFIAHCEMIKNFNEPLVNTPFYAVGDYPLLAPEYPSDEVLYQTMEDPHSLLEVLNKREKFVIQNVYKKFKASTIQEILTPFIRPSQSYYTPLDYTILTKRNEENITPIISKECISSFYTSILKIEQLYPDVKKWIKTSGGEV